MKKSFWLFASLVVLMFAATGCYEVVYNVEWKGDSCIKFEDAMYEVEPDVWVEACLGEDGAVDGDWFYVELEGDPDPDDVEVSVKAGKCKETSATLVWTDTYGAYVGEACGFMILGGPDIDGWSFMLISDDIEGGKGGTAALSNVTFCLGDATVVAPEEGPVSVTRLEEPEIYP